MKTRISLKPMITIGRAELTLIDRWRGYGYFEGVLKLNQHRVSSICLIAKIDPPQLIDGGEWNVEVVSASPELIHEIAIVNGEKVV